jgi:monoamine oxidase|nr:hypothetical protein [uncultured Rhodopila sp.]
MALRDYWEAAMAAAGAFKDDLELTRRTRQEAGQQVQGLEAVAFKDDVELTRRTRQEAEETVSRWEAAADARQAEERNSGRSGEKQERYTREVVDPISGREYTVNVSPYSWGYKYEVRDNESGEVLRESNMQPNLNVAMEDAQSWIENRHNEIHPGGFAADGRWIDGREDDDEMER